MPFTALQGSDIHLKVKKLARKIIDKEKRNVGNKKIKNAKVWVVILSLFKFIT